MRCILPFLVICLCVDSLRIAGTGALEQLLSLSTVWDTADTLHCVSQRLPPLQVVCSLLVGLSETSEAPKQAKIAGSK